MKFADFYMIAILGIQLAECRVNRLAMWKNHHNPRPRSPKPKLRPNIFKRAMIRQMSTVNYCTASTCIKPLRSVTYTSGTAGRPRVTEGIQARHTEHMNSLIYKICCTY